MNKNALTFTNKVAFTAYLADASSSAVAKSRPTVAKVQPIIMCLGLSNEGKTVIEFCNLCLHLMFLIRVNYQCPDNFYASHTPYFK